MPRFLSFVLCLASLGFGSSLSAATIGFEPEDGFHDNIEVGRYSSDNTPFEGDWNEDGFTVSWTYLSEVSSDTIANRETAKSRFTNDAFLSECEFGCEGDAGYRMSFSRDDGRTFTLTGFEILETLSSFYGILSFVPFAEDGSLDNDKEVLEYLPGLYENLVLTGVKRNGSRETVPIATMLKSRELSLGGRWPEVFPSNGRINGSDLLPELRHLDRLDVEMRRFDGSSDSFSRNVLAAGLSAFSDLPEDCDRTCVVPGVGAFTWNWESSVYNWHTATRLDNFKFAVQGAAPAPSPVPLPIPALLLPLALGAMGMLRRKRA